MKYLHLLFVPALIIGMVSRGIFWILDNLNPFLILDPESSIQYRSRRRIQ